MWRVLAVKHELKDLQTSAVQSAEMELGFTELVFREYLRQIQNISYCIIPSKLRAMQSSNDTPTALVNEISHMSFC